jgi:hypothetical protein
MKARCGVRASPSRVISERSFLIASNACYIPVSIRHYQG